MTYTPLIWPPKKLVFASDHAGYPLKKPLIDWAMSNGYDVEDLGADESQSVDYPDFASLLASHLANDPQSGGVLVCGTGIGISIAANRYSHIRAALCHDVTTSRLCREHNDANVLALGARMIGTQTAIDCLEAFLGASFGGGRHEGRVAKLGESGE